MIALRMRDCDDTLDQPLAPLPQDLAGLRLGRVLGRGAAGTVHEAVVVVARGHAAPGTRVAVKVLHPSLSLDPGALARFRREGALGACINHPAVVRTHDALSVDIAGREYHLLVQELVEGRSLAAVLADGAPLPEPLVRSIGASVARGLDAIHCAGTVHRDIKPSNIVVTDAHEVKLADFGVAALRDAASTLTLTGAFVGTPQHAAPEQFRGDMVTPAADLYSTGVVLYECATGVNPFAAPSSAETMRRHLELVPRPASDLNDLITPLLDEVLATLLEKDPRRRLADASELARVMELGEASSWWTPERRARTTLRKRLAPRRAPEGIAQLVGREPELALLRSLAGARTDTGGRTPAPAGRIVVLRGPAGIGKSHLVAALARWFEESMPGALVARAAEAEMTEAASASIVAQVAAALGDHQEGAAQEVRGQALEALFQRAPVLIVVEDLHVADQAARRAFVEMARTAARGGALVVATTRPGLDPDLERALADGTWIDVEPLDAGASEEIVADSIGSAELAAIVAVRLVPRAAGNPFHLLAACRDLADRGVLDLIRDQPDAATRILASLDVPDSVRSLLASTLRQASDQERDILDVAAVQGLRFDGTAIAAVIERPLLAVLQALVRLERRFSLVRSEGRVFRFEHPHVQELLLDSIPEALLVEYHARLARALDGMRGGDEADAALDSRIAQHALRGGLVELGLDTLERAVPLLAASSRHETLVALVGRALDHVDARRPRLSGFLRLRRIAALDALARRAEQREAIVEASAHAELRGDAPLAVECRVALAGLEAAIANYAAAEAHLEPLLADRPADPRIDARVHQILATCRLASGGADHAAELLERARDLLRDAGDPVAMAGCGISLARTLLDAGRLSDAASALRETIQSAASAGLAEVADRARLSLAPVLLNQPALAGAGEVEDLLDAARARFAATGDAFREATALSNLARVASDRGDLARCRELAWRALGLKQSVQDTRGAGAVLTLLVMTALAEGSLDEAEQLIERRDAIVATSTVMSRAFGEQLRAQLAHGRGDLDLAVAHLQAALDMHRQAGHLIDVERMLRRLGGCEIERGHRSRALACLHEASDLAVRRGDTMLMLVACHLATLGEVDPASVEVPVQMSATERAEAHVLLRRAGGGPAHGDAARRLLGMLSAHLDAAGIDAFWRHNPVARAWRRPLDAPESAATIRDRSRHADLGDHRG